jgi:hypothetical protein
MAEQSFHAEAHLEAGASPAEVAAVKAAFDELGVEADVDASLERRGVGDYPWTLFIIVPVTIFLKSFVEAAGKAAGDDAYAQARRFFSRLYDARRQSPAPRGGVTLMDKDTRQWVSIPEDLPEHAWRQLFEMEITKTESGVIQWDPRTETWRDVVDIHRIKR